MSQPAAKQNDPIIATDMHDVTVTGSVTPQSLPHPFNGRLDSGLSSNVFVNGLAAATVGSNASNQPPHIPTAPGVAFVLPPSNRGRVTTGSGTVFINGLAAARSGDTAQTCADPLPNNSGNVVATGNVYIG